MSDPDQAAHSVPARFAQIVARHPRRVAISAPAGEWTYPELDQRANFIAAKILERLGEASEPVALLMDHDAPLVAAILGTLKANKIYLALDPSYPAERLAAMLANSQARILLTDKPNGPLAHSLACDETTVLEIGHHFQMSPPLAKLPAVSSEAGAWLVFTSGSTGIPKGVWQNHGGVIHHSEVYRELISLSPDDRLTLLNSFSLAASTSNLFGALLNGATLCPFHLRSQGSERLAEWLPRERITIYHSVPTVFRHLARSASGKHSFATVRLIRLGGETMQRDDVDIFRRLCPEHSRLMHTLSSSETGLSSALMIDKKTMTPGRRVPVGRAVRSVEIFLVDEKNQPIKNGGVGRIAVRSAYLRRGYWRQPELTAEKFLADGCDPDSRIFISNDLGRMLPDGTLEHLGRADQLVKIRGQRVDLGEVEAALLATELVKEAAVDAREDESGETRLTAYLVPYPGADVSARNLRLKLGSRLPEHMIPGDFLMLTKMPQTGAGKIDRCALSSLPSQHGGRVSLNRRQRPRNFIDARLKRIWESVLKISPIGRHDDFFVLGGTSLQSVEVLLHIEEMFGVSLPPSTLAEHGTIERLAARLADQAVISSPGPLVVLREGGAGRPLFLIHSGQGDVASYGLLTRRLPDRPIFGLQSIGLQGEGWPLMSVPAMARHYLPGILSRDSTGPYLLAGTCMGGMVAFELAQMLVQQGKKVRLLGLLDSHFPLPNPERQTWRKRVYVSVRTPVHDAWQMSRWGIIRSIGLGRNRRLLPAYRRFVAGINGRANRFYRPRFYPGEITLFITSDTKFRGQDTRLMMQSLAKSSRIIEIPGNRAGLFARPAVDELARRLQDAMENVEAKPGDILPVDSGRNHENESSV